MMKQTVLLLLCATIAIASIGCERKPKAKEKEPKKIEQTVSEDIQISEEEPKEHAKQKEDQVEVEEEKTTTQKENKELQKETETPSQKPSVTPSTQVTPEAPTVKPQEEETSRPEAPKATTKDCVAVANQVLMYINSYRQSPATKLPGLTKYAEYRSRQLIGNFAHNTSDERAAATALQYGTYVEPALYGMTGEPYYEAGAREAIAKGGYVGTVDEVAERLAKLVRNSAGHWAYVGSSEYAYIAVGVTYNSGMWYCDIAMARVNTDNY